MSLTSAQEEAVTARGNVLVAAGAGAGKTKTLVERCLHCLLEEQVSLDELLLVTFTEAAAADMRKKIRARLEERILEKRPAAAAGAKSAALSEAELRERRSEAWLAEQLDLFETAHIGTLHSFCLQLVRQHFYELGLDPQLAVMPEEEELLLASEVLDDILQAHYASDLPESAAVQQLIQTQARGWDVPIRALVLRLHHYSQTLRDAAGWFAAQLAMFSSPEPVQWRAWLVEGARAWRDRWLPALRALPDNPNATACAAALENLPDEPSRVQCAAALEQALAADGNWPARRKTALRKPLENFFEEAKFLRSLARTGGAGDPLTEDWDWVRAHMTTLLRLAQEFAAKFADEKRELGVVDFHDLEQHSLRLLIEPGTGQPTVTAKQWREKLRFVFVDEYQDINEAQDAILKALSRDGAHANRFLVGDVKQSIYRFRLADPHIFQNYVATWGGEQMPVPAAGGRIITLADNFRSREAILEFVNAVFGGLMRREIGGVPYDDAARLRFGDAQKRHTLSLAHDAAPRAELLLRMKSGGDDGADEEGGAEMANLEEADKEARLVAARLRGLKDEGHLVWDEDERQMRPVQWSDMAILLRSPSGKAESYAKEFTRLGVPLLVARGGFYDSIEVSDLLSLLRVLDNPLQDLPLLAVLRSPLAGLSPDELAAIRLELPKASFWAALQHFHEAGSERAGAGWAKADRFLKNFGVWRRLARQVSLSRCLESVLGGTHYEAWLLAQTRGEQRQANVQRLLALARQFDRFQRQGLFRFLRFIEAQQAAETEPEVGAVALEDAVSLMSIHQSKGLEFPVVVVADLGKQFNTADLRAEIMLDEQYGLCPQVKPPHTGRRYPSLPYWLARQRQKQELLGEEMRLLYVAMTRARDTLILTGSVSRRDFENRWQEPAVQDVPSLLAARSFLEWLAGWWVNAPGTLASPSSGANALLKWTVHDDDGHLLEKASPDPAEPAAPSAPIEWDKLRERLAWQYPHAAATREPAKTSVSALRRRVADETDAEAAPCFEFKARFASAEKRRDESKLSATEIGTAHHLFLQFVELDRVGSRAELEREVKRLQAEEVLSPLEAGSLDLAALADFWRSNLGQKIRAQGGNVRRELAFTARFAPGELPGPAADAGGLSADDFVVVQGVADLVVLLPEEIWLVDFKTDDVAAAELDGREKLYEPQLQLYARALGRIYRRKVTRMDLHFLTARRTVSLKPPV